LGGEVVEKQDSIEELGEIFDADSAQFFEDFTGTEVTILSRKHVQIEVIKALWYKQEPQWHSR
jgi:hypothetical protein